MPEVVLASYNVHGGVDGWGRPFDVAAECRELGADVLVLEETWSPDEGASLVTQVSAATGLDHVFELEMVRAQMFDPPVGVSRRWGPVIGGGRAHGLRNYHEGIRDGTARLHALASVHPSQRGVVGLAVLTRLPVVRHSMVDLGRLTRDTTRRGALFVELDVAGAPLTVVGTHLSHLAHGSPRQLAQLRRLLPGRDTTAVLAGDMNLWGPPLSAALPGWRRGVRGRTWPAWRPVAQPDHIMVTAVTQVRAGEVMRLVGTRVTGSDHLPIRARIVL